MLTLVTFLVVFCDTIEGRPLVHFPFIQAEFPPIVPLHHDVSSSTIK